MKIYFAPLQGYTDCVFRECHIKNFDGISMYCTPFVRIEKDGIRNHDRKDISFNFNVRQLNEHKLTLQILPGSKEEIIKLTEFAIENGYNKIDINMGCPFPKIVNKNKGTGLLSNPENVEEILNTCKDFPEISYSAKIRLGWLNPENCISLIPVFNQSNLDHITIHPRTGIQQYKGTVDMEYFEKFYTLCKIPIVYNGDILNINDAKIISDKYSKLEGIMIGRGLLTKVSHSLITSRMN